MYVYSMCIRQEIARQVEQVSGLSPLQVTNTVYFGLLYPRI